jgi:dolichol-phosphate mannosyltransferase
MMRFEENGRIEDPPEPAQRKHSTLLKAPLLELAVVIPTFNEIGNIDALLQGLRSVLEGRAYEVIVVDDSSPDGTADHVREIAKSDLRIRCIQRVGRRGLSSAVLEGALASAAPMIAVMDGDMQHDEKLLPMMLEALRSQDLEVVIGSRYLEPRGLGHWAEDRVRLSKWATALARRLTGIMLTDPMSGFFMIRADVLRALAPNLSNIGFKILLDLFLTAPRSLQFAELPYQFRTRSIGTSKLDARIVLEFVELLIDKTVGQLVPAKFVIFALVGSLGVVVHLTVLGTLLKVAGLTFEGSQSAATLVAMTSNFALNNILTYHDRQLSGWAWIKGLVTFASASSVGMFANVGIATYLFSSRELNWIFSALAGIAVGVVWNYATTKFLVWRQ